MNVFSTDTESSYFIHLVFTLTKNFTYNLACYLHLLMSSLLFTTLLLDEVFLFLCYIGGMRMISGGQACQDSFYCYGRLYKGGTDISRVGHAWGGEDPEGLNSFDFSMHFFGLLFIRPANFETPTKPTVLH